MTALGNQERKELKSLKPKCQDFRRRKTTITGPSLQILEGFQRIQDFQQRQALNQDRKIRKRGRRREKQNLERKSEYLSPILISNKGDWPRLRLSHRGHRNQADWTYRLATNPKQLQLLRPEWKTSKTIRNGLKKGNHIQSRRLPD